MESLIQIEIDGKIVDVARVLEAAQARAERLGQHAVTVRVRVDQLNPAPYAPPALTAIYEYDRKAGRWEKTQ